MPLKGRKIINIILDECQTIEERCEGYQEELFEMISDIVMYEAQHRVRGTNIQQKINEKCNATGRFLAKKQGQTKMAEGTSDEANPGRI